MKDLLANVAIAGAAAAAILTLIDWFLTDKNRAALSSLSIRMWNWLDDLSAKPILEWFYRGRSQRMIVGAVLVLSFIFDLFNFTTRLSEKDVAGALGELLGIIFAFYVMFRVAMRISAPVIKWLAASTTEGVYLRRLVVLLVAEATPLVLLSFVVTVLIALFFVDKSSSTLSTTAIILIGFIGIGGLAILPTLLTILAVVGISLLKVVLHLSEFTMRRIAESPKGPILAISALVGGIAAVVKVFG